MLLTQYKINILLLALILSAFCYFLLHGLEQYNSFDKELSKLILYEVRLPRLILATLSGALLGIVGLSLQGLFQNPLASPDLLGNSAAATSSSVALLYFGSFSVTTLLLAGSGASLIALIIVFSIAHRQNTTVLILVGVALNALLGSIIALLLSSAKNPWALSELYNWLQGSFELADLTTILYSLFFIVPGTLLIYFNRHVIDALTLGEETAKSLGFSTKQKLFLNALGCALIIGALIPQTGIIGFVGLVAPHLARLSIKTVPSKLYLTTALYGAILLLSTDLLISHTTFFSKIHVGTLTSFIGAPFLILILLYQKRLI